MLEVLQCSFKKRWKFLLIETIKWFFERSESEGGVFFVVEFFCWRGFFGESQQADAPYECASCFAVCAFFCVSDPSISNLQTSFLSAKSKLQLPFQSPVPHCDECNGSKPIPKKNEQKIWIDELSDYPIALSR